MKRWILVDGSSYFYRAFHALPPLMNSKGQPTGAVYGVINMIKKLRKDFSSDHIVIVFDAKGKTFREELFPEYKANRESMPDELIMQHEPLLAIIKAMGFPLLLLQGVEADDVIGTLTQQITARGLEVVISTGDKDLAQLVNAQVSLINTMTDTVLDEAGVIKKFGVEPSKIIDYLSLIGDKVDNIPGVDKVGPKTATKWLDEYGDLNGIIENADKIKGKVGENLRNSLDQLPLSKQLVTIKQDVELPTDLDSLVLSPPDNKTLKEYYQALEFKTWLHELLQAETVTSTHDYHNLIDKTAFNQFIDELKQAKLFALDTETDSLNYMKANLVGISFYIASSTPVYIPLAHDYPEAPTQLAMDFVLDQLRPILENAEQLKIGQNIKYDYQILKRHGIKLSGIAYDTMLESYVLNSIQSRHDMDSLALKYLGRKTVTFSELVGTGKKQLTFNQVEIEKAANYAAEDAYVTLALHEAMYPLLAEQERSLDVFKKIEMPLVNILAEMELSGVLINADKLREQSKTIAIELKELESKAYQIAGEAFNINSTKQLQEILYDKLGLPIIKKTPKGQPSTAEPILQELAYDYPLPNVILTYRRLSKLKSTYLDTLPEQVNHTTGRIHTSYNQAITATGRLSSTSPNLQNIPIRTEAGRKIRQAFIAPPNKKIVAADYSQIELRIMAHLSGDESLCTAFEKGLDIHSATAAEIFSVPVESVKTEQRRRAKAINFGLIYGMSAFGLAKQISVKRNVAEAYIARYFERYPGVKAYMEETRQMAHAKGYVQTLSGRRLYLPDINAQNILRQKAAERAAINAPMQGTAADIIKLAMISVQEWIDQTKIDSTLLMQVHDELVFEVSETIVTEFIAALPQYMTHVMPLKIPLEISIGMGADWDEAH